MEDGHVEGGLDGAAWRQGDQGELMRADLRPGWWRRKGGKL